MSSFIDLYLDYTSQLETPTSFFKWGAYAIISAVMRDHCYMDSDTRVTYPNIYVLLVADSGISRKSSPIITNVDLLEDVKVTKTIRGRNSIQAILQDLGTPIMDPKTGKQVSGGSCILCADELASFFVQDPAAVPILTDMYDFKKDFTYNLKGTKFVVKNICVTMLAASNETHLREVYNSLAVFGGLVARTFFIRADERRPPNALFGNDPDRLAIDYSGKKQNLVTQLRAISAIKGAFVPTQDARKEYILWYDALYAKYGKRPDKSGILSRIHTGAMKLSMIIAIGDSYELEIKKQHVEKAIDECTKLLPNYELFVMSSGKADISTAGQLLFEILFKAEGHSVTRKRFLVEHWTDVDQEILDKAVVTLESTGYLKSDIIEGQLTYFLTKEGQDRIEEKMGLKKNEG